MNFYVGSINGFVTIFTIGEKFNHWKKKKILKDHENKITCIKSDDYLNIFATCCLNGRINLYTMPKLEIYRTIDLNSCNNFVVTPLINNIYISHSPLPSIILLSNNDNKFYSYSINGEKIAEDDKYQLNVENYTDIDCSEIIKDDNFSEAIVKILISKHFILIHNLLS